jgi:hypothetical protein
MALIADALSLPRPQQQFPVAALNMALGLVVGLASVNAGRLGRTASIWIFGLALLVAVGFPLARYVPGITTLAYEQDVEALFPPFWPFSLSVPLLVALVAELAIPSLRDPALSGVALLLAIAAAVLMLLFGNTLIGVLATKTTLFLFPTIVLAGLAALVALASLMVVAAVMPGRGLGWEGAVLLAMTGLGVEFASTMFYGGPPHFLVQNVFEPLYPHYMPVLAGTVPGVLAVLAALLQAWSMARNGVPSEPEDEAEPLGQGLAR